MRNKYTWIAVNFVLSLSLVVYNMFIDDTELFDLANVDEEQAALLLVLGIAVYLLPVYWLYKTIVWWRNCIRLEDSVFRLATQDNDEETSQILRAEENRE